MTDERIISPTSPSLSEVGIALVAAFLSGMRGDGPGFEEVRTGFVADGYTDEGLVLAATMAGALAVRRLEDLFPGTDPLAELGLIVATVEAEMAKRMADRRRDG